MLSTLAAPIQAEMFTCPLQATILKIHIADVVRLRAIKKYPGDEPMNARFLLDACGPALSAPLNSLDLMFPDQGGSSPRGVVAGFRSWGGGGREGIAAAASGSL